MNDSTHVSRYIQRRVHEARINPAVGPNIRRVATGTDPDLGRWVDFSYPSGRPGHQPHTVRHYRDAQITQCTCEGYTFQGRCYHAADVHQVATDSETPVPLATPGQMALIANLCRVHGLINGTDAGTTEAEASEIISAICTWLNGQRRGIDTPADRWERNTGAPAHEMPCEERLSFEEWRETR